MVVLFADFLIIMNSSISRESALQRDIPVVDFYDDVETWPTSELIHCEPLAERSQRHDWRIHPHRHSQLTQLFFLQKGRGTARIDSIAYDLEAPCVLVIPERCVHEFTWAKNSAGFVLSITSLVNTELMRQLGEHGNVFATHAVVDASEDPAYVEMLFTSIQREYAGALALQELSLDYLIKLLAVWLARCTATESRSDTQSSRAGQHLKRFRKLVDEHHKSHWPVSKYGNAIGITPSHLNAICQQSAGQSALEIVHERLLLAARRDLVYTEKTIAGVSHKLGFADPSYFTRFFKRHTGLPPSQFRRQSGTHSSGSSTQ